MAYKFQRGTAVFSGSLVQSADVIGDGNTDISGSDIVVTAPSAEIKAGDDLVVNHGALAMRNSSLTSGYALQGGRAILSSSADAHVAMTIQHSDGTEMLKLGSAKAAVEGVASEGFLSAFTAGGVKVAHLSGSGAGLVSGIQCAQDMIIGQDLTIGGNLTVVTKTDVTATKFKIEDSKAQIKSTATNLATSVDTGFIIGAAGANRGQILFKSASFSASDVAADGHDSFFGVFGNTDAAYINVSASTYYGDGSNLTGITSAPTFSVSEKTSNSSISAGVSYVTGAVAMTLTLPTGSSLSSGTQFKVKSYGNHDPTNKITISRTGTDTVDGQASIALESPFASVTVIYTGNGEFGVI